MKKQEKTKRQASQNRREIMPRTQPQAVIPAGETIKKHPVTDTEKIQTGKNKTANTGKKKAPETTDVEKIKDPGPAIPEERLDPIGGHESDYSRTRNMPGKKEAALKGEFTDAGDPDGKEEEKPEEKEKEGILNKEHKKEKEEEEEKPRSFDPEMDQKEAFGGAKKNSPDAYKNKNGL